MSLSLSSSQFACSQLESISSKYLKMQNTTQKKQFYTHKKQGLISEKQRKINRKQKQFFPRKNCNGENCKLNLIPFTYNGQKETEKEIIKKTLIKLLKILYEKEKFFQKKSLLYPNLFQTIAVQIASSIYTHKSLAKIPFSSSKYRKIFLQLCLGSYPTKKYPNLPSRLYNYSRYTKKNLLLYFQISPFLF